VYESMPRKRRPDQERLSGSRESAAIVRPRHDDVLSSRAVFERERWGAESQGGMSHLQARTETFFSRRSCHNDPLGSGWCPLPDPKLDALYSPLLCILHLVTEVHGRRLARRGLWLARGDVRANLWKEQRTGKERWACAALPIALSTRTALRKTGGASCSSLA